MFRQKWHETVSKLQGKDKFEEILNFNKNQICEEIEVEMQKNHHLDPVDILMKGSMNVATGFITGQNYKFQDEKFRLISKSIKVY